MTARRIGGIWFWRVGRLGGSVYLARRPAPPRYAGPPPSHYYRRTLLLCGIAR